MKVTLKNEYKINFYKVDLKVCPLEGTLGVCILMCPEDPEQMLNK